VDESRLRHPRDFERAILKLSKQINIAQDRTHIIITSRAPAWRPKTDLAYCNDRLPFTVAATSECAPQAENDDYEGSVQTKTVIQKKDRSGFKIFALEDLTSEQIAVGLLRKSEIDRQNIYLSVYSTNLLLLVNNP
jgi:hypothetical protein